MAKQISKQLSVQNKSSLKQDSSNKVSLEKNTLKKGTQKKENTPQNQTIKPSLESKMDPEP